MKDFSRDELIEIRERAEILATEKYLNEIWQRAYFALADAADHLHAMWVRATKELQKEE